MYEEAGLRIEGKDGETGRKFTGLGRGKAKQEAAAQVGAGQLPSSQ